MQKAFLLLEIALVIKRTLALPKQLQLRRKGYYIMKQQNYTHVQTKDAHLHLDITGANTASFKRVL